MDSEEKIFFKEIDQPETIIVYGGHRSEQNEPLAVRANKNDTNVNK